MNKHGPWLSDRKVEAQVNRPGFPGGSDPGQNQVMDK
jgi:hypothetical protein